MFEDGSKNFKKQDISKNLKLKDRIILWKNYWLEYIEAFSKLSEDLPNSVVTIYVGRHALEIGFKYLLLKKTHQVVKEHDLEKLANLFFLTYQIKEDYMQDVDTFCHYFTQNIESDNKEYFRFPEYKQNHYFAGDFLDIKWLSYNIALIILKLIHFAKEQDVSNFIDERLF